MQQDPMGAARSSVNTTHGEDGHIWRACEPVWSKKQRTIKPKRIKNMSTLLWVKSYGSQFLLCCSQLWIQDFHDSWHFIILIYTYDYSDWTRTRIWLPASFLHHWDVCTPSAGHLRFCRSKSHQKNPFVLYFWRSVWLPWWINGSSCVFTTCVS